MMRSGPVLLDGVHVGRGNHLVHLVPGAAHEAAQATLLLPFLAGLLVLTMAAQASTGLLATASAARQCFKRRPRTRGYFTRLAEYKYQLYDAPRAQPRGS